MDCTECKGTGKVPDQNYRTSQAKVETKLEPKVPFWKRFHFPKLAKYRWENWPDEAKGLIVFFIIVGTIVGSITFTITTVNHITDNHIAIAQQSWEPYVNKMGYVVVEYDSNIDPTFHPVRCWVVGPKEKLHVTKHWYMEPSFPIAIEHNPNFKALEIGDINDPNGFIRQMGVKDPSTCVHL